MDNSHYKNKTNILMLIAILALASSNGFSAGFSYARGEDVFPVLSVLILIFLFFSLYFWVRSQTLAAESHQIRKHIEFLKAVQAYLEKELPKRKRGRPRKDAKNG